MTATSSAASERATGSTAAGASGRIDPWSHSWKAARHQSRYFWITTALWTVFFCVPLATGLVVSTAFDSLEAGSFGRAQVLAATLLAVELFRIVVLKVAIVWFVRFWIQVQSVLRANMLRSQLASGGPFATRPVASAGGALPAFRDDTNDIAQFLDNWIDVIGSAVYAVFALAILATIDVRAALAIVIPLALVSVFTQAISDKIKEFHRADRLATEEVTGLLGDTLTAVESITVNDAVGPVSHRLAELMETRRRTAVKDRTLREILQAVANGVSDLALGLVLLLVAASLASGDLDAADLVLFAAYLGHMTMLPRMIGHTIGRRRHVQVAFERMSALVRDEEPDRLVDEHHVFDEPPPVVRPSRVELARFEVSGLTVCFDDAEEPILRDVDLAVDRGAFVVITGEIGTGKSTLLRAVAGLVDHHVVTRTVRWNGDLIDDPAEFLVPPRCAYMPQVPRLLSDTVRENVRLGSGDDGVVSAALRGAAVAVDVAGMPAGLDTSVGPRGLRLSGGQRQRLALARALVHAPEMVILDDLSSAVDVVTEAELWSNLADAGTTVIAVSHRQVAFDRADVVYELRSGRLWPL